MKYEITKGSEKDFDGAPEWATMKCHCTIGDPSEIKNENVAFSDGVVRGSRWVDAFGGGEEGVIHREEQWHIIAERRPITEPAWSGEGLPPVGTKCEVQTSSNSPWFECEIVYSGESGAAFTSTKSNSIGCVDDSCTDFFRPIRSPEDVARDDFIKKLSGNVIEGFSIGTKFAAALYDAGYRKME